MLRPRRCLRGHHEIFKYSLSLLDSTTISFFQRTNPRRPRTLAWVACVQGEARPAERQCTRKLWLPRDSTSLSCVLNGPRNLPQILKSKNMAMGISCQDKRGHSSRSLWSTRVPLPTTPAVSLLRFINGHFMFSKSSLHPLGTFGHQENVGHTYCFSR